MKKVAFFDIDNVLYEGHTIFDFIQYQEKTKQIKSGLWSRILDDLKMYKLGAKTYVEAANSMLKNYANALKGLKYNELKLSSDSFFGSNNKKFFTYFSKLSPLLTANYEVYLVTTNFQFITESIASKYNIQNYLSSNLETKDNIITGKMNLSMAGNKGQIITIVDKYGKPGSIAVGDSENDIDMFKNVEKPFAFEPDERTKKLAAINKWMVVDRNNAYDLISNLI